MNDLVLQPDVELKGTFDKFASVRDGELDQVGSMLAAQGVKFGATETKFEQLEHEQKLCLENAHNIFRAEVAKMHSTLCRRT